MFMQLLSETRIQVRMAGEQPRQPKDMQGLLKFCLEATRWDHG
jgi:hypothetical protein